MSSYSKSLYSKMCFCYLDCRWNSFAGKMSQLVNARDEDPKHRSDAASEKDDASGMMFLLHCAALVLSES